MSQPVRATPLDLHRSGHTLLAPLRKAYRGRVDALSVREKPEIHVGGHLRRNVGFAVRAESAIQIAQAWSFQKGSVEDVATEVKSWG